MTEIPARARNLASGEGVEPKAPLEKVTRLAKVKVLPALGSPGQPQRRFSGGNFRDTGRADVECERSDDSEVAAATAEAPPDPPPNVSSATPVQEMITAGVARP